jgi:hypothetical protein
MKKLVLILTIIGLFQVNNFYSSEANPLAGGIKVGMQIANYCTDYIFNDECEEPPEPTCDSLRADLNRLVDEYHSLGCGSSSDCTRNIRARHHILVQLRDMGCLSTGPSTNSPLLNSPPVKRLPLPMRHYLQQVE